MAMSVDEIVKKIQTCRSVIEKTKKEQIICQERYNERMRMLNEEFNLSSIEEGKVLLKAMQDEVRDLTEDIESRLVELGNKLKGVGV